MRCLVLKKKNIIPKTQNTNSIRVLYKKVGQTPKVKIINNIYKLKKAIIQKKLDIVPYEKLFTSYAPKYFSSTSSNYRRFSRS